MDNGTAAYIRKLDERLAQLESGIQGAKIQGGIGASMPGQYPGKPIPTIEGVEIVVPVSQVVQQGNIVLAADGPFMARAIHFGWRATGGNNPGYWRPVASSKDPALAGIGFDCMNFYWEYQVTGSHRNRQNIPVPSAVAENGDFGRGFFEFLTEDAFGASSTITVRITPTRNPDSAGVLYVGFSGVYLLQ